MYGARSQIVGEKLDSCQNASRSYAVVVSQNASESLPTFDRAILLSDVLIRINQTIPKALVVSFMVIEFHELVDRIPQGAFSEEDNAI